MIAKHGDGLWTVDGDRVHMLTVPFETRMTVVRLGNGDLWLHSPVEPTDARVEALLAIGRVRHIVSPNKFHHLFAKPWLERFPDAIGWAEPALASRRPDLHFDHTLGDEAEADWKLEIDQLLFGGSRVLGEAAFHHLASRTLIVTDIIQNHDPALDGVFWRWVKRVNRIAAPNGEAPWDWRLTVRDRKAARASLERLLCWDFDRVILSHGICIDTGGREFVENAFRWLQRA